jgi:TonB family protein
MTRRATLRIGWLLLSACASQPAPNSVPQLRGDTCLSVAEAGVSAATAQQLGAASNLLEYENVWKAGHPAATTGTISGAEVRSTIRGNLAHVQACYEPVLNGPAAEGGRVVVRFVIDGSGHVVAANIGSNSFGAPEVGCCVVKQVAQWRFPAPVAGGFVTVEYPFVVRIQHSR